VTRTVVLPSSDDPVVAGAVEAVGGKPGAHARLGDRRFWNPVRVLIALTLMTSALGFALKVPCRDGSNWVNEYQYTRACYTDVVALYGAEGLSAGKTPYYDHPVEYPVVIGAVMQVSSLLARGVASVLPPDSRERAAQARLAKATTPKERADAVSAVQYAQGLERSRFFYDITWLILTGCAVIAVVATAKLAGRRVWDAALFALAPGLLLHATTNWDLVAVAIAGLGLLAWARSRPVVAGVLLGLATATKLYPILFLVPLFFLCLRAGKVRTWAVAAAMTVVAAVGVTAPVYLTAPYFADKGGQLVKVLDSPLDRIGSEGLGALKPKVTTPDGLTAVNSVYRFFELNKTRGADWDSLYHQAQHLRTSNGAFKDLRNTVADWYTDTGPVPTKLNRWVAVLVLLVLAGVGSLTLAASRRPRVPQVLFLTLAGFLLVNKVDSPQYVVWLLPLAALANPRWRPFLAWQAAEVLVLLSRFYFFIGNDKPGQGISNGWFFAAIWLRDILLVVFASYVVRDILHPERDPVRRDGADDPAGGVLDGAPDRAPDRAPART
jgi:uncharacterized membrane protein